MKMNILKIDGSLDYFETNEEAAGILRSKGCQIGKNFRIGKRFECSRNFKCGDNFYCIGEVELNGDFECGDNFTVLADDNICSTNFKFKCGNNFYAKSFIIKGIFECGDNCRLGDNFLSTVSFKAGNNFKCGKYFLVEGEFVCGNNCKFCDYPLLGSKSHVFKDNVKYRSYASFPFWKILLISLGAYIVAHILTAIICAVFNIK